VARTMTLVGDYRMMNREETSVARHIWLPALLIAGFLVLDATGGGVFEPRPVKRPPNPRPEAAAAALGTNDDTRAPASGGESGNGGAAPDLMAQDERVGGLLGGTSDTGQAQKKVEGLRSQLQVNPSDYRLHYELGNALYDAGDPQAAISAYRRAVELNPRFVKAYVNMGETQRERGDVKDAVSTLEKAVALEDRNDVAHAALGFAYYSDRRYPDAMHQFQAALDINPKSVHATYYMGMAFADAQIYREAIKWWEKVCEIDPSSDACLEARENVSLLKRIVN
jgi:tetratricopeptide (TPR) repeat protein